MEERTGRELAESKKQEGSCDELKYGVSTTRLLQPSKKELM